MLAAPVRLSADSMPSSKPSEISCTGQPSCSSIVNLSKKESTAAASLRRAMQGNNLTISWDGNVMFCVSAST